MTQTTLAPFLRPDGYTPLPVRALLRETRVVTEATRHVARRGVNRVRPSLPHLRADRTAAPVVLVPGFFLGDLTLAPLAGALRADGRRAYASRIRMNVGCTLDALDQLEMRVEQVAARREQKVQVVGHSLGGLLARSVAARRPDLVEGIVTLGSPMQAPGALHPLLTLGVEGLTRLSRAGVPGLMESDCVAGECARTAYEICRTPLVDGLHFTAITSPKDGVVDHRACVDPQARVVEVRASHLGMVIDPQVVDVVRQAVALPAGGSLVELDRGEVA